MEYFKFLDFRNVLSKIIYFSHHAKLFSLCHFLRRRHPRCSTAEPFLEHLPVTTSALREKCLYSEFFCFVFSRVRTKYGEIRSTPVTECLF